MSPPGLADHQSHPIHVMYCTLTKVFFQDMLIIQKIDMTMILYVRPPIRTTTENPYFTTPSLPSYPVDNPFLTTPRPPLLPTGRPAFPPVITPTPRNPFFTTPPPAGRWVGFRGSELSPQNASSEL